jgi:hypothetical protein
MKYSIEQRYRAIQRQKGLHKEAVKKEKKIKESYPIEVELKDGYYIIESKMNYENN